MNTRTMRREVYEAHEMMRKSQIRKRCISRCRRAFIRKLKNVGIAVILVAVAAAGIVKGVEYFGNNAFDKEAKSMAQVVEPTDTVSSVKNPIFASTLSMIIYEPLPTNGLTNVEWSGPINADNIVIATPSINEIADDLEEDEPIIEDAKQTVKDEEVSKEETNEITTSEPEVVTPEHEVVTCDTVLEFPVVGADGYTYTEEDYQYLLMIIVGESQNCSKQHQMYVGSVVLNRLHNKKYFSYADCIKDIALAPNQYTCFNGPNAYRDPTDLNIEVAKELILYGSVLPSNVIFQAQFKQGQGVYIQLGNTYFCWKD